MKKEKNGEKYSPWQGVFYVLKTVWREDRFLIFLSVLRIPTLILLPLCGIYLPKLVVELVTDQAAVGTLLLTVGLLVAVMVLLNIYKNYSEAVTQIRSRGYYFDFHKKIFAKLMDTDYENVESFRGQSMREKALPRGYSGFGVGIDEIINSVVVIVSCVGGFVSYSGLLSTVNPLIILMLLAMTGVNYLALTKARTYEAGYLERRSVFERRLSYQIRNGRDFKNGKDIRLYRMVPWLKGRFAKDLKERDREIQLFVNQQNKARVIDFVMVFVRDGVTYAYLLYLVFQGRMDVADFIFFTGAVAGFSTWITDLIDQINWVARSGILANHVREYLEMEDHFNRGEGAALPGKEELPCQIEFRNVTFSYEKDAPPVFENFNLTIEAGEKLALVGVNGAGKTTLVKLLCGLYHPQKGEILVAGKPVEEYNRDEYLNLFSVAFQDVHVLPVSIAQNVAMCPKEEIDKRKVEDCLKKAGLYEKVHSLPAGDETMLVKGVYDQALDLSGGETQKLVFARALYRNAPILVLDEPTAALDPIAEDSLYREYETVAKDRTSLFISHRLSSTRFCDRIIFMEQGKILEEGTHEELLKNQKGYAKMFEIQSQYYREGKEGENQV